MGLSKDTHYVWLIYSAEINTNFECARVIAVYDNEPRAVEMVRQMNRIEQRKRKPQLEFDKVKRQVIS